LLRFWINDPVEGATNVRGAVVLALWDAFKREGIAIPSPIHDIRLRGGTHAALDQSEPAGPRRIKTVG
jgi:small-conductance mechanosensitive channel